MLDMNAKLAGRQDITRGSLFVLCVYVGCSRGFRLKDTM